MATPAQVKELKTKLTALVKDKFGGDFDKALASYANSRGNAGKAELMRVLKDAGVGNRLTRGMWVNGVIEELDTNKDGEISPAEFLSTLS